MKIRPAIQEKILDSYFASDIDIEVHSSVKLTEISVWLSHPTLKVSMPVSFQVSNVDTQLMSPLDIIKLSSIQ
jgi:hypothetical protein